MYLINRLVTRVQQYLKAIHCKLFFFFFFFLCVHRHFFSSRRDRYQGQKRVLLVSVVSSSAPRSGGCDLNLKKKRSKKTSSHILMKETSTGTAVENTRKLQLIVSSPPTHFFRVSNMVKVFLYPFY